MNEIKVSKVKSYEITITADCRFEHYLTIDAVSKKDAKQKAYKYMDTDEFVAVTNDGSNYSGDDGYEIEIDGEPYDEYQDEQDMNENSFSLKNLTQEGMFVDPPFAKIPGDETKRKTPKDVMEKHNIGIDTLKQKLKKGIKVETEHSTNTMIAAQIALVHLYEDINYYENNPNIEERFQKKKGSKSVKEIKISKEVNLYRDIKQYYEQRYSFYSHDLSDSQINNLIEKALEDPRCPKTVEEIIPWVAFRIDDYIISNGLANDIQP